tara:strand:- start:9087 stop:9266 length:180 start_codon:yes stop_codon:yes gene_type:complete
MKDYILSLKIGVLHLIIFIFGGTVRLEQMEYPLVLITIARISFAISIVKIIMTYIKYKT